MQRFGLFILSFSGFVMLNLLSLTRVFAQYETPVEGWKSIFKGEFGADAKNEALLNLVDWYSFSDLTQCLSYAKQLPATYRAQQADNFAVALSRAYAFAHQNDSFNAHGKVLGMQSGTFARAMHAAYGAFLQNHFAKLDSLAKAAEPLANTTKQYIDAKSLQAMALLELGDYKPANIMLRELSTKCKAENLIQRRLWVDLQRATMLCNIGNTNDGLPIFQQNIATKKTLGIQSIYRDYFALGKAYQLLKIGVQAHTYYQKVLDMDSLALPLSDYPHIKTATYINKGAFAKWRETPKESLSLLNQGIALANKRRSYSQMLTGLLNKARFYISLGQVDSSYAQYQKALALVSKVNNPYKTASLQVNLGEFYFRIAYAPPGLVKPYMVNGATVNKQTLVLKAIDYLEKGKKGLQPLPGVVVYQKLSYCFKLLKDAYKVMEQYDQAFAAYDGYMKIKDSLANQVNVKELVRNQVQHNNDLLRYQDSVQNHLAILAKDQALAIEQTKTANQRNMLIAALIIAVLLVFLVVYLTKTSRKLKRYNAEISSQNTAIEKRNKQIEWLLKEIHHRVKNNMQIVSSLMSIQGRAVQDETAKQIIRESQNRLKSMSFIHESLYLSQDVSMVDIAPFIKKIAQSVQQSLQAQQQQIALLVEAENLQLTAEQAVPVGIIINELVSNAYKHAFHQREKGELHVAFKQEGQQFTLHVGDDGKALNTDASTSFSGTSIGMALVESLATEQLGGTFATAATGKAKFSIAFNAGQAA